MNKINDQNIDTLVVDEANKTLKVNESSEAMFGAKVNNFFWGTLSGGVLVGGLLDIVDTYHKHAEEINDYFRQFDASNPVGTYIALGAIALVGGINMYSNIRKFQNRDIADKNIVELDMNKGTISTTTYKELPNAVSYNQTSVDRITNIAISQGPMQKKHNNGKITLTWFRHKNQESEIGETSFYVNNPDKVVEGINKILPVYKGTKLTIKNE